jgi:hypothetical protein
MAGRGRKFKFHGSFKTKKAAKKREATCACFILKRAKRYLVLEKN